MSSRITNRSLNGYHWPRLSLQKVTVPEGRRGSWEVKRFTVKVEDAKRFNLGLMFQGGQGHRTIAPGTYTGLYRDKKEPGRNDPWMSDTPAEMLDHSYFVHEAVGRVLITGLGIGLCIHNLLLKPEVKQIIVVEKEADVVALVAPHYKDPRVRIVHADAFEWKPAMMPGAKFDFAWHDIWPEINADHCPEIAKLVRHYQPYVVKGGQSAWCQEEMRWKRDEDRNRGWF